MLINRKYKSKINIEVLYKKRKEVIYMNEDIRTELINSFENKEDLWEVEYFIKIYGLQLDKIFPHEIGTHLRINVITAFNGLMVALLDDKLQMKYLFKCPKCNKEIYDLTEFVYQCPECKAQTNKPDYYYPYFILTEEYKKYLQKQEEKKNNKIKNNS